MDIILSFVTVFVLLMVSNALGIYILYPLLLGLVIFIAVSVRRGFGIKSVLPMALKGSKR